MPGWSMSGFHRPGQTSLAPIAKHREAFGESREGGRATYQELLVRLIVWCSHSVRSGPASLNELTVGTVLHGDLDSDRIQQATLG